MKAKLISVVEGTGVRYTALKFRCPGCAEGMISGLHVLPVNSPQHKPSWNWDGNLDAPTISPSIHTVSGPRENSFICHSFLKAGIFEFLNDSTHSLAGQKVPMPDL